MVEKIVHQIYDKLDEYLVARGYGKIVLMSQLRTMINNMQYQDFVDLINSITNPEMFDVLIGVGLKGIFWHTAVKRQAELMGV